MSAEDKENLAPISLVASSTPLKDKPKCYPLQTASDVNQAKLQSKPWEAAAIQAGRICQATLMKELEDLRGSVSAEELAKDLLTTELAKSKEALTRLTAEQRVLREQIDARQTEVLQAAEEARKSQRLTALQEDLQLQLSALSSALQRLKHDYTGQYSSHQKLLTQYDKLHMENTRLRAEITRHSDALMELELKETAAHKAFMKQKCKLDRQRLSLVRDNAVFRDTLEGKSQTYLAEVSLMKQRYEEAIKNSQALLCFNSKEAEVEAQFELKKIWLDRQAAEDSIAMARAEKDELEGAMRFLAHQSTQLAHEADLVRTESAVQSTHHTQTSLAFCGVCFLLGILAFVLTAKSLAGLRLV
jgi:chromosome segregation ATPase